MKQLLFLLPLLYFSLVVSSQNITNKEFALIDYDLEITDNFRDHTKMLEDFYREAEVHNKDTKDRLKAILIHHLYYNLTPQLERKMKISILPINSFMQKVNYDEFGYPEASINRALRKGDSPYYFKVEVTLDSKYEGDDDEKVTPHFSLGITVFNDEGIIPVYKWKGERASSEVITVDKMLFAGFVKSLPEAGANSITLTSLYDQAITKLMNNFLDE